MKKKKIRYKDSHLIQPCIEIDEKYKNKPIEQYKNEIRLCKNGLEGIKYFINNYIYVPNKIEQRIINTNPKQFQHLDFENDKINLKLYPKQEEYLERLFTNRLVATYKSRQTGISTITQAYILQYALFNNSKEIVIVSKSETEAIKFLESIYYMYNHLPFFLRRPYSKAVTKTFWIGDRNSATKITVLTSTVKSGRSFSATILVLDEAEFIDHADTLQGAAQPTLSATGGQAILISTPQMYNSQFWGICNGDAGSAFDVFSIHWSDIPGRDDEWYQEQCKELNYDQMKIKTELDMQWIIPFTLYFNEEYLNNKYVVTKKQCSHYDHKQSLYLLTEYNPNEIYFFGIDTYEQGNDFNAGTIIDSTGRIAAFFKTKRIDIFSLIKDLCDMYNVKANIEKNRGFWLIKEFMDNNIAEKYLLYQLKKQKGIEKKYFGYTVNENRQMILSYMSSWIKDVYSFNEKNDQTNWILIPSELMEEMKYFVIKNKKIEGLKHDDGLFSLGAALFVHNNIELFHNIDKKLIKQKHISHENFYDIVNDPQTKRKKQISIENFHKLIYGTTNFSSSMNADDVLFMEKILNHSK